MMLVRSNGDEHIHQTSRGSRIKEADRASRRAGQESPQPGARPGRYAGFGSAGEGFVRLTAFGLPENVKGENLYNIQSLKIHRNTDFYDKDKDGKNETLIVHVQPTDDQLDVIKAIGEVDVQLWDLNQPDGQAMLAEWNIAPEELKKTWTVTMFTISYRLTFQIAEIVKSFDKPLTVKVKFTDYLTGKIFEEQRVIKP